MSKDKNTRLISALHKVAEMVGARKEVNGNNIGLGMQLQYNRCMEEARMVTDGLFRVVVMGTFTSGKSTLINALLGSRILPESALPSTAILTFIQFGCDTDDVEIHYRDIVNEDGNVTKGAVEHISKENFMQTYHYDIADTEKLSQTGSIPRFKKVTYSIVRCSLPLVQYGVSIVDTPGLEDKDVATELALDIAAKAQAIIYVCGERGFAEADREYFEENFKGNPGNVFFILNKMDNITSDIQRKQARGERGPANLCNADNNSGESARRQCQPHHHMARVCPKPAQRIYGHGHADGHTRTRNAGRRNNVPRHR